MTIKQEKITFGFLLAVTLVIAGTLIALGKSTEEVVTGSFSVWCFLGTIVILGKHLFFPENTKNTNTEKK